MANRLYRKFPSKGPPGEKPGKVPQGADRTASWPGLPGKSQTRSRSGGTPKIKSHPHSEGI